MGVARFLALVTLVAFCPQDELTLDQLLDRMDTAAASARGRSYEVMEVGPWARGSRFRVDVALDGTIRVQDRILMPDALYLTKRRERLTPNTAGSTCPLGSDPAGLLLRALAPHRAFAFEQGLRIAGRRRLAGEECFVLVSRSKPEPRPAISSLGNGGNRFEARRFYVGARDFKLKRMESLGGSWDCPDFVFVLPDGLFVLKLENWDGDFPRRIAREWSWITLEEPHWYEITPLKTDQNRAGRSLRLPASDLYASRARDARLNELLRERPDDLDLLLSRALAIQGTVERSAPSPELIEAYEAVLKRSWVPQVALALIEIHAGRGDRDKAIPLIESFDKDGSLELDLRMEVASALNELGLHERALQILARPEAVPPVRLIAERIRTHIAREDLKSALEEIAGAADPASLPDLALTLGSRADSRKSSDEQGEVLLKEIDQALRTHPSSPGLHLARLLLMEDGDLRSLASVAREAVRVATHPDHFEFIIRRLTYRLTGPSLRDDHQAVRRAVPDLDQALKADNPNPRVSALRALTFARAGDVAGATYAFDESCQRLARIREYDLFWVVVDVLHEAAVCFDDPKPYRQLLQATLRAPAALISSSLHRQFYTAGDRQKLHRDLARTAVENESSAEVLKAVADMIKNESTRGMPVAPPELWLLHEKAREKDPRDVEVLYLLADHCSSQGRPAAAALALEDAVRELRRVPRRLPRWLLLYLAELQSRMGDLASAKGTLAEIDLEDGELGTIGYARAAVVLERLGDLARAASCLERTRETGHGGYVRLAGICEKLGDWTEALRALNRAVEEGDDWGFPESEAGAWKPREGPTPNELRERLLKRVGRNFFIKRLLDESFPAMSADDERHAQQAYQRLTSEDPSERDAGIEQLRRMDAKDEDEEERAHAPSTPGRDLTVPARRGLIEVEDPAVLGEILPGLTVWRQGFRLPVTRRRWSRELDHRQLLAVADLAPSCNRKLRCCVERPLIPVPRCMTRGSSENRSFQYCEPIRKPAALPGQYDPHGSGAAGA